MPITANLGGKNHTLGRGKVFFGRFTQAQLDAGISDSTLPEGMVYIGNTPEFGQSASEESLDHFDSDAGVRVKDNSVSLQVDRTGSFQTDNISAKNLALQFMAAGVLTVTQSSATAATYQRTVKRGMFYTVGESASVPTGVRNISNVVVAKGVGFGTNVVSANNWQVDEATGRIFILDAAADIPDDTLIQITYDAAAGTREQVVAGSRSIYGQLHFVADNPKGTNRDYLYPYVKLSPEGDFQLKGDNWQAMSFNFEALQKGTNVANLYVDGRQAA